MYTILQLEKFMPRRRLSTLAAAPAEPNPQLLSMAPASGLAERAAEAIVLGVASGCSPGSAWSRSSSPAFSR
jgi:hypothetical protein